MDAKLGKLIADIERAPESGKLPMMVRLMEISGAVTLRDAVGGASRSFNQLIKTDKAEKGEIMQMLVNYMNFMLRQMFNRDRGLEIGQILIFMDEVMKIEYLTVEDIICFVNGIKSGRYGKIYGKIDLSTLNEWFDTYLDERDAEYHKTRSAKQYEEEYSPRTNAVAPIRNFEKHNEQLFGKNVKRETYEQFVKRTGHAVEG